MGIHEEPTHETDCFWCGTVFDPTDQACPYCSSTLQTGAITVIVDGED